MKRTLLVLIFLCGISLLSFSQSANTKSVKHKSFDFFALKHSNEEKSVTCFKLKYIDSICFPIEIRIQEKKKNKKMCFIEGAKSIAYYSSKSKRWSLGYDNDLIVINKDKIISVFRYTGDDDSSKYSSILVQIIKADSNNFKMNYFLLWDMNNNIHHEVPEIKIDTCDLSTEIQWLFEYAYATIQYEFIVRNGTIVSTEIIKSKDIEYFNNNNWPVIVPYFNPDKCNGLKFDRIVLDVLLGHNTSLQRL